MQVGEGACECYWLEPTGEVSVYLRRFVFGLYSDEEPYSKHRACANGATRDAGDRGTYTQGCDASSGEIARTALRIDRKKYEHPVMMFVPRRLHPPHRDPRWPQVCSSCGEPFQRDDMRQVNQNEIYTRGDNGAEMVVRGNYDPSAAGALYDAWWRHGMSGGDGGGYVGPDGISLAAVCPNGQHWEVDGPARNGGRWTRSGDPRVAGTLTVSPSIMAGDYHGWLGVNGAPPGHFSAHIG